MFKGVFREKFKYFWILWVFTFVFVFDFCSAGVDIVRKEKNNIVSYFLKVNQIEYKILYLPKSGDNPRIINDIRRAVFSDEPVKYEVRYDEWVGKYGIFINGKKLFYFDKNWAYLLGYYSLQDLVKSYLVNLENFKYLPEVFFDRNYIEVLVNDTAYVKIYNKTDKSFSLNIPEYCYYGNGNLVIRSDKPAFKQAVLLDYPGGQDVLYLTVKMPSFYLKYDRNIVKYTNFSYVKNFDFFKSFIYPNLDIKSDGNFYYEAESKEYGLNFSLFTKDSRFPFKDVKKNYKIIFQKDKEINDVRFDSLIISNNPEKIGKKGIIFDSQIMEGKGYWIWFHHLFEANLNYCVEIQNQEDREVKVEFFVNLNKSKSETETGLKTSVDFFGFLKNKDLVKVNLLPYQKVRLVFEKCYVNQVITGFVYLRSSEKLGLKIFAYDKVLSEDVMEPDGSVRTTGKFHNPLIIKEFEYRTSKNFDSFRVPGNEVLLNNESKNYSNYGVLYKIIFKIHNDQDFNQRVNLYFSAISGYTPLVFFRNGEVFRVDSGMYRKMFSVLIEPGEIVE
ncbi:MAG: hypothetical protein ACK4ZM_03405, partial [bacterium]